MQHFKWFLFAPFLSIYSLSLFCYIVVYYVNGGHYGLRGESLMWLIEAVVCLLAANRGSKSNRSLKRAMDGRIVRCGIISSCRLAATSNIVKRFWS